MPEILIIDIGATNNLVPTIVEYCNKTSLGSYSAPGRTSQERTDVESKSPPLQEPNLVMQRVKPAPERGYDAPSAVY
jgi:hypothetical protein